MKKFICLFLSCLILVGATACSNSNTVEGDLGEDKLSYEELESQLEAITKERDSLESEITSLESELDELRAKIEEKEKAVTVQEGDVTVLVTDKTVTEKDSSNWIFSNYVNFVFSITNNTEKDIQGIQGNLTVYDLFGEEIMNVKCDFTGNTIKAGEAITEDSLSFECNEFISEHMKLFNEEYRDLKFDYICKKIVFTDGSVKEQ